jgi:hypothetical protein
MPRVVVVVVGLIKAPSIAPRRVPIHGLETRFGSVCGSAPNMYAMSF